MLVVKEIKENGKYEIQNYDDLKLEIENIVKPFLTLVVDENNVSDIKGDVAKLNKVEKILNDTRIKAEKEYLEPFNVGKNQFKELCNIIKSATNNLKSQIDLIETERKKEKMEMIKPIYEIELKDYLSVLTLDRLYVEKWNNKTYSIKNIETELIAIKETIDKDIAVIKSMVNDDEKIITMLTIYFDKLDLGETIKEFKEMETKKGNIRKLWQTLTTKAI